MFNDLLKDITKSGFHAEMHPKSDQIPFPQIWMTLGTHIMQIRDHVEKIPSEERPMSGSDIHFFEFFITFPYEIKRELFNDAARLASLINKSTPIGNFFLSEADHALVFQYTYPTTKLDQREIDSVLHLLLYSTESFSSYVKEFAEKKISYDELITRVN